jgi:hypothetical protein
VRRSTNCNSYQPYRHEVADTQATLSTIHELEGMHFLQSIMDVKTRRAPLFNAEHTIAAGAAGRARAELMGGCFDSPDLMLKHSPSVCTLSPSIIQAWRREWPVFRARGLKEGSRASQQQQQARPASAERRVLCERVVQPAVVH